MKDTMKSGIRQLFAGFALAALYAGSPLGAAAEPIQLRISSPAPPGEIVVKAMERFKDDLAKEAPGQFDVSVHAGSSLFKQGTEIPAMQRGNLEMNTLATFEVSAQVKELSVYTAGYLFRDYPHTQAVWKGPIGARYIDVVRDKMGIRLLADCYLGTRQLTISKVRNVKTPQDLKGVKLRMPGAPDFLLLGRGLGIIPTPMAMSEVYLAIQNGAVDGQDNPPTITRAAKMHEVAKELVLTGHMVQTIFVAIAEPVFQKMTQGQQGLVTAASERACAWNDETRRADEDKQITFFKENGIVVTQPDVDAFRKNMWAVYEQEGKLKEWPAEIITAIRDTR